MLQKILHRLQVRKFGSLPAVRTTCLPVWTSSCPKLQPSGWRVISSRCTSDKSIILPDGVDFSPDLPLCRDASNYSSLHPARRFSSPSGQLSVFDQASGFLSKHRYGKITVTVRTVWYPVRTLSSVRQVSQFKSSCPNASQYGLDACASDMEIVCIRSVVQTRLSNRKDLLQNFQNFG